MFLDNCKTIKHAEFTECVSYRTLTQLAVPTGQLFLISFHGQLSFSLPLTQAAAQQQAAGEALSLSLSLQQASRLQML
jgi:hypothetical protein